MSQNFTTLQAAEYLNLSPHTLTMWRQQGRGPAYLKFGRCVRYDRLALDQWVDGCFMAGEAA